MLPNIFAREQHEIAAVPLAGYLRERFHDDRFFVYRHRLTRRWEACYWLDRSRGVFLELIGHTNLGEFERSDIESIDWWYHKRGPTGKELAREILAQERREAVREAEEAQAAIDYKRWLGKQAGVHVDDHWFWSIPGL